MNRNQAVEKALACFDDGRYLEDLRRRVAIPTESQEAATRMPDLYRYLIEEIGPCFAAMGYEWRIFDNPFPGAGPVQIGRAHVRTPVTNAHLVCSLLLDQKTQTKQDKRATHSILLTTTEKV